ncbi:hypothetical protein M501DRAFT_997379 [Patellaria atrata CBS 101060]|uniref:Uncharacterized protein n=1 Tax=Patellaria atrata CBS 101060 TaxID=1346257 RepID=A0A9P4S6U9_9PEZI|nr:hypothetical protein M501DRAFT_997379 [Patellaria atrata CBS 101060]
MPHRGGPVPRTSVQFIKLLLMKTLPHFVLIEVYRVVLTSYLLMASLLNHFIYQGIYPHISHTVS